MSRDDTRDVEQPPRDVEQSLPCDAELPPGVLIARVGAGANCSSAGSAIDILFYTSVIAGAVAVALSAAFPPRPAEAQRAEEDGAPPDAPSGDDPRGQVR